MDLGRIAGTTGCQPVACVNQHAVSLGKPLALNALLRIAPAIAETHSKHLATITIWF